MSPAEIRAYVIADNKLAENAGWDEALLALELKELSLEDDFDLTDMGFETAEIDLLLQQDVAESDKADEIPSIDRSMAPVSRRGDLWKIGNHRLLCGDATSTQDIAILLGGASAQLVFTDPPYNVPVDGHVCVSGKIKHREFAMASGEMTEKEFEAFLASVFRNLASFSADGSLHFICMDWRHIREVMASGTEVYSELKNLCVWAKSNAGMGSLYRSQHELVFVFKNGTKPHVNNVELGKHGRNRTNVWNYPGANSFSKDRDAELAMHPTVKPVALVADAILDGSNRGDIVLDVFAGSGTTLVAAENTGRRGFGMEIDPQYADTIIKRLSENCGLKAVLSEGDLDFNIVRAMREKGNECHD
jgi:DNA modification methylase